jgi:hypothetical protein
MNERCVADAEADSGVGSGGSGPVPSFDFFSVLFGLGMVDHLVCSSVSADDG